MLTFYSRPPTLSMFDDLFSSFDSFFYGPRLTRSRPRVELEKMEDGYVFSADLPGMRAEDLTATYEKGVFTIKGSRTTEVPEGFEAVRRERGNLTFERSFTLPEDANVEAVEAKLTNGVLTVTIPLVAPEPAKVIEVKAS